MYNYTTWIHFFRKKIESVITKKFYALLGVDHIKF